MNSNTLTMPSISFQLTEEHLAVQQAARDFAQTELLPGVIERDDNEYFPDELVRKMGELGFLGMMVDPKYGGGGMDTISYVLAMEELSKIDASASVMVSMAMTKGSVSGTFSLKSSIFVIFIN